MKNSDINSLIALNRSVIATSKRQKTAHVIFHETILDFRHEFDELPLTCPIKLWQIPN